MLAGKPYGNFPEGTKGETRDQLGAAVGVSGRTLEKADEEAKERQREHGGTAPGKQSRQVGGSDKGEARDLVAEAVGLGQTVWESYHK